MILHRRPLADRGSPGRTNGNAVINPRIRVCSTVVLRSCLQPRATALWCLRSVSVNGGMPAPSVIDNEHQSSSVTTGCPTVCSTTSTLSSTTAATHGTSWRLSPGLSCPSACAIGPIGSDQRDLVLALWRRHIMFSLTSGDGQVSAADDVGVWSDVFGRR
jgi:hypothetical protein